MTSFKNVMSRNINKKTFEKTYYEECIANWLMHGWLTDEEASGCLGELDKVFVA